MAVTRTGRSVVMTAVNDTIVDPVLGRLKCTSIRLVGTSMAIGERLLIRTKGVSTGDIVVDHYVKGTNEDEELWGVSAEGELIDRPYLAVVPTLGTWSVLFRHR